MKTHFENYRIIFTGLPQDLLTIPILEIETLPFDEFIYTVALTKYSDFVISVDTALVHIAAAYHKPTLAFYLIHVLGISLAFNLVPESS